MDRQHQKGMKPNKRYRICTVSRMGFFSPVEDYTLYSILRNGIIHIYKHDVTSCENNYFNPSCDFSNDPRWIEEGFLDVKLLWRIAVEGEVSACYVILKELNGNGRVIELLGKNTIMRDFLFNSYVGGTYKRGFFNDEIKDTILRFWNREKKYFELYSIRERKIIFSYNYISIDFYDKGVILDERVAVAYYGFIKDFSGYEYDNEMFYDKEKNDYWMIVDERKKDGQFMAPFEQDEYNKDILKLDTDNFTYTYNKKTEELKREQHRYEESIDWSEYADVAYEGYSRLSLGLED